MNESKSKFNNKTACLYRDGLNPHNWDPLLCPGPATGKTYNGQVKNEARSLFKQIVITRRWIADHGCIFVESLPWVRPNPYFTEIKKETETIDRKGR